MPAIVSPRFLINYFADKQFCQKARTFRVFCVYSDKSLSCKFSRQKCNFCKQILHFCKPAPEFSKTRTIIFKRKERRGNKTRNGATFAAPFLGFPRYLLLRSTSHSVSYTRAVDATSSRSRTE